MKFFLMVAVLAGSPARAGVVISEVLFNEIGSDVSGEWIEIYNHGPETVNLGGWKIGDEEARGATGLTEAMMVFPPGSSIASGQVQVIAMNANLFFVQYGFLPDYETASGTAGDHPEVPNLTNDPVWDPDGGVINLSNSNDHVLLLNAEEEIVDRVNWGNNGGLNPGLDPDAEADGQSWQRINPRINTGTAADWELVPLDRLSTPGTVTRPFLFQAEIVNGPRGPTLRWPAWTGAAGYRVQMSESLAAWSNVASQLTVTEWVLPEALPERVFFRVLAD